MKKFFLKREYSKASLFISVFLCFNLLGCSYFGKTQYNGWHRIDGQNLTRSDLRYAARDCDISNDIGSDVRFLKKKSADITNLSALELGRMLQIMNEADRLTQCMEKKGYVYISVK